eukprot:768500-Hanusia_phi.AAC.6
MTLRLCRCWAVKIDELRIDELDSLLEQELFYPFLSFSILMQGCHVPVEHGAAAGLELGPLDMSPACLLLPPQRSTGPPVLLFSAEETSSCSSPRAAEQFAWLERFELRATHPDIDPTDCEEVREMKSEMCVKWIGRGVGKDLHEKRRKECEHWEGKEEQDEDELTLLQLEEHLRLRIPLTGQSLVLLISLRALDKSGNEVAVASASVKPLGLRRELRDGRCR